MVAGKYAWTVAAFARDRVRFGLHIGTGQPNGPINTAMMTFADVQTYQDPELGRRMKDAGLDSSGELNEAFSSGPREEGRRCIIGEDRSTTSRRHS